MSGTRQIPVHLRVDSVASSQQLALFGRGRSFAPYHQWEDFLAGMFSGRMSEDRAAAAQNLLAQPPECLPAMLRIIREWPVASAVNLSNTAMNQRAWIGQAACCLSVGASANETKRAWWQLTEDERTRANACADEVITLWRTERI